VGKPSKWGWLVIEQGRFQKVDDGQVQAVVCITIRQWHPGYWLFYWGIAFRTARELGTPFHKWFPVALARFFMPRKYEGNLK
jgi:hypothetical protein